MAQEQEYDVVIKLRVHNYGLPKEEVRKILESGMPDELRLGSYTIGVIVGSWVVSLVERE